MSGFLDLNPGPPRTGGASQAPLMPAPVLLDRVTR
jgi:hypothetical protein